MSNVVRFITAVLCLSFTLGGCIGPFGASVHPEPGHLSAIEVPEDSPARAASLTENELDRAPELRRVLDTATADENGSASLRVPPEHVDRVSTLLAGKPSYGPDEPAFHHDGVYVRHDDATALVKISNITEKIYVKPYEVTASDVPINDLDERAAENRSRLATLVEEAVAQDGVVSRSLNSSIGEGVFAELTDLVPYRPAYNDRRYWGSIVEYRDRRFAVSMWKNDTAT